MMLMDVLYFLKLLRFYRDYNGRLSFQLKNIEVS